MTQRVGGWTGLDAPYRAWAVYVVERGGLRTFLKEKSSLSAFAPVDFFLFAMGVSSEPEE